MTNFIPSTLSSLLIIKNSSLPEPIKKISDAFSVSLYAYEFKNFLSSYSISTYLSYVPTVALSLVTYNVIIEKIIAKNVSSSDLNFKIISCISNASVSIIDIANKVSSIVLVVLAFTNKTSILYRSFATFNCLYTLIHSYKTKSFPSFSEVFKNISSSLYAKYSAAYNNSEESRRVSRAYRGLPLFSEPQNYRSNVGDGPDSASIRGRHRSIERPDTSSRLLPFSHINEPLLGMIDLEPLDDIVDLKDFETLWNFLCPSYLPVTMQDDYQEHATLNPKEAFLKVVKDINENGYQIKSELLGTENQEEFVRTLKTKLQHILQSIQSTVNEENGDLGTAALAISNLAIAFTHCQTSVSEVIDRTCREICHGTKASRDLEFKDQVLLFLHNRRHQILENIIGNLCYDQGELVAITKRYKKLYKKEYGLHGQEIAEKFQCVYDTLGILPSHRTVTDEFKNDYTKENIIQEICDVLKESGNKLLSFPMAFTIFKEQLNLSRDPKYGYIDEDTYLFTPKAIEAILTHLDILKQ